VVVQADLAAILALQVQQGATAVAVEAGLLALVDLEATALFLAAAAAVAAAAGRVILELVVMAAVATFVFGLGNFG
jgi:hypothetical protein